MHQLAPGTTIGPYVVVNTLGEGGMGAVYQATDSRLNRTVAIKFIKQEFTDRFEREARAIAALSDPRICAIHDVGQHEGTPYLVMEHIVGEPLAGPVPEATAIRYGIEICQALDLAHRKGIVHRDLKPANILVTKGGIKLLDFGLAKHEASAAAAAGPTDLTSTLIRAGENTISGTPAYMAPEQVEGKAADARSDIFSFGCVLYEMLSGSPAFTGPSVAAILAAVLAIEPKPVRESGPNVSPALEAILQRCLVKDPDQRWQSAADIAAALGLVSQLSKPAAAPKRSLLPFALAAAGLLITLAGTAAYFWPRPAPPKVVRFDVPIPAGHDPSRLGGLALSPDGSMIAFVSAEPQKQPSVWVRQLDALESRPIPGTEGARSPVWSPDSRHIAFGAGSELKRVSITGGDVRLVGALTESGAPSHWLEENRILIAQRNSPIQVMALSSGELKPVTRMNASFGDRAHSAPTPLAEYDLLLYRASGEDDKSQWRMARLSTGEELATLPIDASRVNWDPAGFLVYSTDTFLVARRLNRKLGTFEGPPINIGEAPATPIMPRDSVFAISHNGVLAYRTRASVSESQIRLYSRNGTPLSQLEPPADYSNPAVSRNGRLVAVGIRNSARKRDIWIIDLARGSRTRLTQDPADDFNPVWSPDGTRIVFASDRLGTRDLFIKTVDSTEPEKVFYQAPRDQTPEGWSPDGRLILFNEIGGAGVVVKTIPADGSSAAPVAATDAKYLEYHSELSPDGKFIVFDSNTNVRSIYVRSFPDTGARWQVSPADGVEPHFSPDGKEIYFFKDGALWTVPVTAAGGRVTAGIAKQLFPIDLPPLLRNRMAVLPDGRLLITARIPVRDRNPIAAVVNWRSLIPQ